MQPIVIPAAIKGSPGPQSKTMILITWSPELGVYTVLADNRPRQIVTNEDLNGRLAHLRPVFDQARHAVESGRSVMGIHVEV